MEDNNMTHFHLCATLEPRQLQQIFNNLRQHTFPSKIISNCGSEDSVTYDDDGTEREHVSSEEVTPVNTAVLPLNRRHLQTIVIDLTVPRGRIFVLVELERRLRVDLIAARRAVETPLKVPGVR